MTLDVIPQDLDAEDAILGAMMWSTTAIEAADDIGLITADFNSGPNGHIFDAIRAQHQQGVVDEVTVIAGLTVLGQLDKCGGPARIWGLKERSPATANARAYARRVKDVQTLRRIADAGHEIHRLAIEGQTPVDKLVMRAGELVAGMDSGSGADSSFRTLDEIVGPLYEDMQERHDNPDQKRGLQTGFGAFDYMTGGLQAGNLIVVAGRPAMGKSAWGMNIATNIAMNHGIDVGVFTLEMSDNELTSRVLADVGSVNGKRINTGTPRASDFVAVTEAMKRIAQQAPGRIHVDSRTDLTPYRARTAARRLNRDLVRKGRKLGLIVIDYLGLMQPDGRAENRNAEVSQITASLKRLAGEMQIPVVLLSQLSRSVENRPSKRPILSDLRDSGSIEQDANVVAFLYRPEYYDKDNPDLKGRAELIVAKNRMGETGDFWMDFTPEFTRFQTSRTA